MNAESPPSFPAQNSTLTGQGSDPVEHALSPEIRLYWHVSNACTAAIDTVEGWWKSLPMFHSRSPRKATASVIAPHENQLDLDELDVSALVLGLSSADRQHAELMRDMTRLSLDAGGYAYGDGVSADVLVAAAQLLRLGTLYESNGQALQHQWFHLPPADRADTSLRVLLARRALIRGDIPHPVYDIVRNSQRAQNRDSDSQPPSFLHPHAVELVAFLNEVVDAMQIKDISIADALAYVAGRKNINDHVVQTLTESIEGKMHLFHDNDGRPEYPALFRYVNRTPIVPRPLPRPLVDPAIVQILQRQGISPEAARYYSDFELWLLTGKRRPQVTVSQEAAAFLPPELLQNETIFVRNN